MHSQKIQAQHQSLQNKPVLTMMLSPPLMNPTKLIKLPLIKSPKKQTKHSHDLNYRRHRSHHRNRNRFNDLPFLYVCKYIRLKTELATPKYSQLHPRPFWSYRKCIQQNHPILYNSQSTQYPQNSGTIHQHHQNHHHQWKHLCRISRKMECQNINNPHMAQFKITLYWCSMQL